MKVSKQWLNDFVEVSGYSTQELSDVFNRIGHEVAAVTTYCVPQGVVLGFVETCEKHPDAEKLHVCHVNVGNEVLQIVCGAKNIRQGVFVAIATIGTLLPNNIMIKKAKLRGIESSGMICSAEELGLPKINEGVLIFDTSLGELVAGKSLSDYPCLNDSVIELELTANRGDCHNILGTAREVACGLEISLKELRFDDEEELEKGIGRVFSFEHDSQTNSLVGYKVCQNGDFELPFAIALRLACVGLSWKSSLEALLLYTRYSTGVIVQACGYRQEPTVPEERIQARLKVCDDGFERLFLNGQKALTLGVIQETESFVTDEDALIIFQTSYIQPNSLAQLIAKNKPKTDDLSYYAVRGSNPDIHFGLNFLIRLIRRYTSLMLFNGMTSLSGNFAHSPMKIDLDVLRSIIGIHIEKNSVVSILRRLGFEVSLPAESEKCVVTSPLWRHDIENIFDVSEEIMRIYGIDSIPSIPFVFAEENRINSDFILFRRSKEIRSRAIAQGFYEALHFIYASKSEALDYGFSVIDELNDITNPITSELNTLRTSLLINMINSVMRNTNNGYLKVPLFEIGTTFDKQGKESQKIAFIWSGQKEESHIFNSGKPTNINFFEFFQKLNSVISHLTLSETNTAPSYAHPYQYAKVYYYDKCIGEIGKLHPLLEQKLGIEETFFCECDFSLLLNHSIIATEINRYQKSKRDMTLDIPITLSYGVIKSVIDSLIIDELVEYFPLDSYKPEQTQECALTLRFIFQPQSEALTEEIIAKRMENIAEALMTQLGIVRK